MVKNLPANAGDLGSIPGMERSLGEGNGYLLQYSCLENSMELLGTVDEVAKSRTLLGSLMFSLFFIWYCVNLKCTV